MSTESMMPSNHIIPCCPLLCLLSIFPSTNESALHIRWPKYWSFSFSISPSNDYSGLTSLEEVWSTYRPRDSQRVFSNTTVQKYQFFNAQPSLWSMTSLWYMTTEKTIALNLWIFVDKMMSPGGSEGKASAWNAGDLGSIPKIPWRRKCQPAPVFLPGKSHGQRSLVVYM